MNRTVAGAGEHGIAAEWPDVFECYCGALVGKYLRNDIDHFTIHGVARRTGVQGVGMVETMSRTVNKHRFSG